MLRKTFHVSALFLAASLVASAAQAVYIASLADDFTYAENSTTSTWSYGQEDNNTNPLTLNLYADNTRSAATMWGAMSPSEPTVWADAAGYWGIGKNTTATTVTGADLTWAPGAVVFHPEGAYPVGRLDIVWTAPLAMTIDANWTFATATLTGNGVGLQLSKLSGGVMTTLIGFGAGGVTVNISGDPAVRNSTPIVGSLTSYDVLAGDKLFFQMDTWGDAGGDITSAAITVTSNIPEPSTLALLTAGLLGLLAYAWRKRN